MEGLLSTKPTPSSFYTYSCQKILCEADPLAARVLVDSLPGPPGSPPQWMLTYMGVAKIVGFYI